VRSHEEKMRAGMWEDIEDYLERELYDDAGVLFGQLVKEVACGGLELDDAEVLVRAIEGELI
jgi:hypothetical protein